jgi:predicted regulator of Ras-like GTPase activity (Roadblock/LC7/MglB family)
MKNGLKEINETPGVWGSLISNNQGSLIEDLSPPALNKATLENVSRHVLDMIGTLGEDLVGLNEVVLHYTQRKVFAVDIQQALLIVICTPSVDIALLRMSVNVVLARWQGDPKIQKQFGKAFVERG